LKEHEDVATLQLPAKDYRAFRVNAVNLKTDLAMSRPIVVIVCIFSSSNGGSLYSTHICGTHVPVEEPSTASIKQVGRPVNVT
jgi:hypothetical protein